MNMPKEELPGTWERYIENVPPVKTFAEDKLRLANVVGSDQRHIELLLMVLAEWRI